MTNARPSAPRGTSFAGGRYLLLREIARGGTATVHLAYDTLRDAPCAIKVLAPKLAAREENRQRFRRECEAMSRIRHPNVLHVHTWGIVNKRMFLVTEHAEGGSVGAWVRTHGPMPPQQAIHTAIAICAGVGAAHQLGVVHRDIKPDNVLLTRDGVVRVCDFGIAQVRLADEHPLTRTGTSMGTLGFMSPEQLDEPRDVDRRADVYSIGATLWFLLRGRVPAYAFRADPYEDGVPGPLCPIVARATAYRREERYDDLFALQADLQEVALRLPADPEPTEPPPADRPTDEPELTLLDSE